MFDAVVVVGGRAYNFNMDGKLDRAAFDAFLGSVILDPGATAAVPPLTQAFTSTRHGFSIGVPADWLVKAATAPWPTGTEAAAPPAPMLDVFTAPSLPVKFVVASSPLAPGATADSWLTAYEKSAPQMPAVCWPPLNQMETTTIDGQQAWIHGGLAGCGFTEAITFAGGRVYELTGYYQGSLPIDRGLFLALLGTVRLDPASADDAPVIPQPS
jgi:hypothetical protein